MSDIIYKYDYNLVLKMIYLLNRISVTNISHVTIPMVLTLPTPLEYIDFTFTAEDNT